MSRLKRALTATTAPSRPHVNRRVVDMTRVRAPVRHMALPGHELACTDLIENETVDALIKRAGWATRLGRKWSFRLPTIAVLNGKPLLQRMWRKVRLRADDVLEFWSKPLGSRGSGVKSVIGIVAVLALAAFAPWAGGLLAASSFGTALGVSASVFSGLILIGGSLLISALTAPRPGAQNDTDQINVDPIYSVSAGGNAARLLQARPVQYGRQKSFPDYAITPWSEFEGNDQYLNVLLAQGEGRYSYETLYLDDTILWDPTNGVAEQFAANTQVAFYNPNTNVTLFPTNVDQADEVSGQTITVTGVGGFIANNAGTTCTALAIDLVFPGGCFTVDDEGHIGSSSVGIHVEFRPVDDAGAPLASYSTLFDKNYTFATRNPQRVTEKVTVGSGRYEVAVYRTEGEITGTGGSNSVAWAGLRAFIDGPNAFPVSTVAIRIKANDQLTQGSAKKFGVLCTRMLNVWDTNTQTFVLQATRNPAWAFYDAATNTDYGANRPPSKMDFQGVFDLASAADLRGDTFDFRFTSAIPAPSAFDTILKVTRARHRWSGDVLTVVRDEWSDTPRMLLTDREIIRGSLNIDYALNTDDSADAVVVQYLDENTWAPAEIQYPKNTMSFTAVNPQRIQVDGIVNRDQAHREAAFYYLCSQLRRVAITLDTEHDGRMLGFGSRVRVQTELPQSWGYAGAVVARSTNTLTLSPAPTWAPSGTHYIAIRDKTGRQFGPIACTKGATDDLCVLDGTDLASVETAQSTTLADALERRDGAEDPSFEFGIGTARARSCLVISGRPSGEKVTLKLIVDNQDVHDTDPGDTPVLPDPFPLRDPKAPLIVNLFAIFRQGIAEPILDVSWAPAPGAVYYNAEVSYDSGASWTPIYQGQNTQCSALVDYAALLVRVQGVGERKGAWVEASVSAPTIQVRDQAVALESLKNGIQSYIRNLEDRIEEVETIAQRVAGAAAEQDAANVIDRARTRGTLQSRTTEFRTGLNDANASITEVQQVAADNEAAIATIQDTVVAQFADVLSSIEINATAIATLDTSFTQYKTQVTASFGGLQAQVTTNANAVAGINGKLNASYGVTLTVDGYATGFYNYNSGVGTGVAGFHVDYFYIAAPGQTGGNAKKVFSLGTIGGIASLGITGTIVLDGSIIARHINVGTLSAIAANLGTITAGVLTSADGRFYIDLNNKQIVVSD